MPSPTWSPQQAAIFGWFATGSGHLVVRARAGTGKTTTILEGIGRAPDHWILLCAFNKRIAEELTRRLRNPRAEVRTLHSAGFAVIRQMWTTVRVDADRGFRLAKRAWAEDRGGLAENAPDIPASLASRLAALIKNTHPEGCGPDEAVDLAYLFNLVPENGWADTLTVEEVAALALRVCRLARDRDGTVDYDDMLWLPVVHRWARPTYDLLVVDEAQDMNATQLALARMLCRGRIAVVGDDKQAIYAFRGADTRALDRLKAELGATELPLTTTYRCPRRVVEHAQALCPDYMAAPGAPDGTVAVMTEEQMLAEAEPTDFILSRLNAPLARLCLALFRANKPARIEGRDITKPLAAHIRRMRATSLPDLFKRLAAWRDRELSKLMATGRPSAQARIDALYDQTETLEALGDGLADVPELLARIDDFFGERRGPAIVLSTVHRAKGLEARRVFVLTETLYCRGRRFTEEERNIHYVALTRALETLVLVGKGSGPAEKKL